MDSREQVGSSPTRGAGSDAPSFKAAGLTQLLAESLPAELAELLTAHIRSRRWFRGKARPIEDIKILDQVSLGANPHELTLAIVRVRYVADPPEVYVVPLALAPDRASAGSAPLFELTDRGWAYDPTGGQQLSQQLLELQLHAQTLGQAGRVVSQPSAALAAGLGGKAPARVPSGEQSNTSVFYGQELMLKLFRLLEAGDNPDVEINEFLWRRGYRNVPEPLGSMRYERDGFVSTLGITQRFVPSQGTAWDITLELLQRSFEGVLQHAPALEEARPSLDLIDSSEQEPPDSIAALVGPYAELAKLLGRRTAGLHVALASDSQNEAFRPEPMTNEHKTTLVKHARDRIARNFDLLGRQLSTLQPAAAGLAREVLAARDVLMHKVDDAASRDITASLIRFHGDYHLGQVLYDGKDFILLDFEGEPAQPIEIRRRKGSALYDVSGMLRSFHYAATFALQDARWSPEQRVALRGAADLWYHWTSALFLGAYLREARAGGQKPVFLPETPEQLKALLPLHLLDKCGYELGYELNNRPDWVAVPLAGLLTLVGKPL